MEKNEYPMKHPRGSSPPPDDGYQRHHGRGRRGADKPIPELSESQERHNERTKDGGKESE